MSKRTHSRLLVASVVTAVAAIAVSMLLVVVYSQHLSNVRRAEQSAGCERANIQRRYINEIVVRLELGMPPIPIPVCADIIH